MKKICTVCGNKVSQRKDGLMDGLLNSEERKRYLKVKQGYTVCLACKRTLLHLQILSPFK